MKRREMGPGERRWPAPPESVSVWRSENLRQPAEHHGQTSGTMG